MIHAIKDKKGKSLQIACTGVLTDKGIFMEDGSILSGGRVFELAKKLSESWKNRNWKGFYEAMSAAREFSRDEYRLLSGIVIDKNGTIVYNALDDVVDILNP